MSVNIKTSNGLKKVAGALNTVSAELIIAALGYTPVSKSSFDSEIDSLNERITELSKKISWKEFN